ncbi:CsbD-like protein [Streptomyces sp. KY75]|nr:CsbD-like protein [Streptomyces sp. KY75]CAD5990878.1 CsbD-like protein [Streptomyces sp. KY70]
MRALPSGALRGDMDRSTVELLLTAQEDTMRDMRRLLRAKVLKARGLIKESDGKALDDPERTDEGRRRQAEAREEERKRNRPGGPSGH